MKKRHSIHMSKSHFSRYGFQAQGLVEFALVLPVLLILLFVFIEAARIFHAYLAIENGARQGVRYAITGEFDPAKCPMGGCITDGDKKQARLQSIYDEAHESSTSIARNGSALWNDAGYFKTTVCVGPHSETDEQRYLPPDPSIPFDSADCKYGDDPGGPGDMVSVTVDFNHPLISPILNAIWPEFHLTARREALVESFRKERLASGPPVYTAISSTKTPTVTVSPTITLTATITNTPDGTLTATPDCSLIYANPVKKDDYWGLRVWNDNEAFPYLIRSYFEWPTSLDAFHHLGSYFPYKNYWYYVWDDRNIYYSPIIQDGDAYWEEEYRPQADWLAKFWGEDLQSVWGTFYLELTFEFPGWGTCLITGGETIEKPSTWTPTATPTAGPSPTASATGEPTETATWGPSETPTLTRTPRATKTPTAWGGITDTPTSECTPTITETDDGGDPGD